MTDRQIAVLVCTGAGMFLIYLGVSGLLGYRRLSYIFPDAYGLRTSMANYGAIPGGIATILSAILIAVRPPVVWARLITILSSLFGITGFLFAMIEPTFMIPAWYRWLVENHEDLLPELRRDVVKMGYSKWRKRTATQEGLEQWVAEVRQSRMKIWRPD